MIIYLNCFLSITFTKMQCEEALLFMEPSLKQCKKIFIFQRMSIGVLLGELQQYVPLSFIWKKMCPKLFLWQAVVCLHAWMHKLQVFFSLSIFTKLAKIRCFLNYVEGIFNELTWVNVISKSPESLRWSIAIVFFLRCPLPCVVCLKLNNFNFLLETTLQILFFVWCILGVKRNKL